MPDEKQIDIALKEREKRIRIKWNVRNWIYVEFFN
jgi:hypothetical protein